MKPTDEEYRWLAKRWYMNQRQRVILLSNSKGKYRRKTLTVCDTVKGS